MPNEYNGTELIWVSLNILHYHTALNLGSYICPFALFFDKKPVATLAGGLAIHPNNVLASHVAERHKAKVTHA